MSQQEQAAPPTEAPEAAPVAAPESPSQTEQILKELASAIDSGHDLTVKSTRVNVSHAIETKLQVPYGNVTKLVPRALRMAAERAGGPPAEPVKRNLGGSSSEVNVPPPVQQEQPEKKDTPGAATPGQASEPQVSQQPKPAGTIDYHAVIARCNSLDEIRGTSEYAFVRMNYEMAFKQGAFKMYEMFGIPVKPEETKAVDALCDAWAIEHMKNNWQFPDWLGKVMLIGGTLAILALPPLAHFGILDDIKSGKLGKKKEDGKKSAEPLAPVQKKV